MKNVATDLIRSYFRDRTMLGLTLALFVVTIAYIIYIGLALEPSDLQVATRYTAFGDTHFYRSKWYYLLSFIAFGVVMTTIHTAFAIKLYGRNQRQLAMGVLLFTLFLFIIGWLLAGSVLRIAFL